MGRFKMSIADHTGETSSVTFGMSDLTAVNIDAELAAGLALQTAVMQVSRGKLLTTEYVAKTSPQGVGRASDPEAQREEKALVKYYDSVTYERGTLEIPCADMSLQNPDYPGVFWLAGAANNSTLWDDVVNAMIALIPGGGGNPILVESIIHVGRRL